MNRDLLKDIQEMARFMKLTKTALHTGLIIYGQPWKMTASLCCMVRA